MGKIERFVNGFGEISRIASTASVCILAKIRVMSFRMACRIASTSGVATLEDFLSLGYPKPLVFQAKRKVEMEEKKRNIRIDQDGTRHAPVPMWQELPQITIRRATSKREFPDLCGSVRGVRLNHDRCCRFWSGCAFKRYVTQWNSCPLFL